MIHNNSIMKHLNCARLFFAAGLILNLVAAGSAQAQIAKWTFETSLPAGTPGAGVWLTNVAPEIGSGSASGWHAGAATYSNPVGNGSAHSFSANTWAVGDLYQFASSTAGFNNISVSYDQTSSGTGPGKFDFQYSTDGSTFATYTGSYTVNSNAAPNPAWNAVTSSSLYSYSYDLSAVTVLNNANVWFRLVDSSTVSAGGGVTAAGGTDRVDNFTIAVVPEPQGLPLVGGFGVLAWSFVRRRRQGRITK